MITVFTPTYNRKNTLNKLYESLLSQTDKNFEWLVVDDGSTDGTESYFADISSRENPFDVVYVKQQNGGKHRAINKGVSLARGEIFFIVDSDDYLTPDAVEKLSAWINTLGNEKKWAGVSGCRGYENGKTIGGGITKKFIDAKNTERRKYGLLGDKAEAYFTEVLKKYPFPEFDGENFITEEVVWNRIAEDGYYLRWFGDIIYICEYLEGGLTKSGDEKYAKNPQGTLYWAKLHLRVFHGKLRDEMKAVCRYYEAVKGKKTKKEIAEELGVGRFFISFSLFIKKIRNLISGKNG